MLVFVENIRHKYDFQGGWGGLWLGLGVGVGSGGPDLKKKCFNRLLIHISNVDRYQCLMLVYSDSLSSFFTKLSNNNMGASWGVSDVPCDVPHHRGVI